MSLGNTSIHQRGEIPEITKLPNGRIRVVRRFQKFTREDVDNENLGSLMGDFGDLDTAGEQVANQGYTNCRLISVEVDNGYSSVSNTDKAILIKTYETLTDSFVQITDDTVNFTENGLKQITRVYRAISGTTSSNVVGVTALGTGEILASSKIEDNDAFAELTETYIEAGILSRTEDLVGSQKAIVIEAFGEVPTTPSKFSLASKQESNYEGFQTNRFTFLKNNVQLSQTEDKVGSQLAISQQWFNPSADKTIAGYSLASRNISDFEGIETIEFRFLKPSILSVQQDLNNGLKRVSVQAFNLDSAAVSAALSEVTLDHKLIATDESDYEGIKTTTFQYQIDESFTEDYELNGLKRISLIELSATNFTAQEVGSVSTTDPTTDLYLGTQSIDNGGIIKVRESTWLDSGQISKSEVQGPDGLPKTKMVTYVSQITEPTSSGILLSKNIDNTGGYKIYTYKYLEGKIAGTSPTGVLQSYEQIIEVRKAGSVKAIGGTSSSLPYITSIPPRIGKVKATVSIELTSSSTVSVPVAYNLSDTSCSATTVNTKVTPVGVEQGGSLTVAVYNTRQSTSHQPFSNYYIDRTGTEDEGSNAGSITTEASIIRDNNSIIGDTLYEVSSTVITLTGSDTEPPTTGLYDQILDPVFIDASGTQFYRKTSYTIPDTEPPTTGS